jgi:4-amino-4-deoxy-L-arabinose transferase-like glycosyltransferase
MSAAKRKKSRQSKKKKAPGKISEVRRTDLTGGPRQDIVLKYVLNGLLFIYLFYYLFQLYTSIDQTFFWADENKHAYVCAVVSEIKGIPKILPDDLYGGYRWSYPPLFHILGAVFLGIAGFDALKFFNLTLLIIFLISFFGLIRKHYGNNQAVVACFLITLSPVLAINAVRFTTEMLSMLFTFFSFIFLAISLKKADKINAIISGLFTGALMLSKQIGFVILGFYGLLLLWFFWRDKEKFKILLWVIGVSVGIYSPYLIWALYNKVEVLGFIFVFLGIMEKPEWSATALKSFAKSSSGIKEFAILFYEGNGIVLTFSFLLPIYHFIKTRFKDEPQNYIFLLSIYLTVVMMAWHITNSRHTIILLPLIAFLAGYALNQITTKPLIIRALIVLLFINAGYMIYKMPNYRQENNAPAEFVGLSEVIEKDSSSDSRILCLRKFDAIMHLKIPAIWPHAKLNNIPIELLEKQNADDLYRLLKKYKIKFILIEAPLIARIDKFQGRSYPLYFARRCEQLERRGKLALKALTTSKRFILLKVI